MRSIIFISTWNPLQHAFFKSENINYISIVEFHVKKWFEFVIYISYLKGSIIKDFS